MNEILTETDKCPFCGHKFGENTVNQRALKPNTMLNGKYLIGKVLGEGGFGITYLALDLILNLKVAIKEYFPLQFASRNVYDGNSNNLVIIGGESSDGFKKGLARYEAEARRLVNLGSLPGIVSVLTFFYENNTAYMVMEYISGTNLKEYVENRGAGLKWSETLEIMRPIIQSLAILHKKEIVHRDISPDNIMISDAGKVTLIDFGAAREIDNSGKSRTVELKHGFAPPEQYQTHGNQGPWTDVYELCATIYYLISRHVLPASFALHDKTAAIEPLHIYDKGISSKMEKVIAKGLETNIKDRIRDMDELYGLLYSGRRIIPWRWIKIGSFMTVCVGALTIVIILLPSYIFEKNTKGKQMDNSKDFSQEEVVNENTETLDVEQDGLSDEINNAREYVDSNGLSYTNENFIEFTDNGEGITITGVDNSLTNVIIPELIDGKKVTSISGMGSNATLIVLPDSLKSIEKSAFKNCVYLETIYIPKSVTFIGERAFENCLSLRNIIISPNNSLYEIEDGKIVDSNGRVFN